MSIAILGGGVEGQATARYFAPTGHSIHIFNNFTPEDLPDFNLDQFEQVFRSPSVRPAPLLGLPSHNWTSATRHFFAHCPAPIIGVTGTKGKGTTCSLIASILRATDRTVHLVGNIGVPALSVLDKIQPDDIVVYELSSFQLWDLTKSPYIAVITRIEPDHLDIHPDFADYLNAKANIVKHQTADDYCIYYRNNQDSEKIAQLSPGHLLPYPPDGAEEIINTTAEASEKTSENSATTPESSETPATTISKSPENSTTSTDNTSAPLAQALSHLQLPGAHNRENATAALLACATFYHLSLDDFLTQYQAQIAKGLADFRGLPHRLEFIRELGGVQYYDDNYSSAFPALDVAIKTFEHRPTILIAGGKDRGLDLTEMKRRIFSAPNLKKVILIGETSKKLAEGEYPSQYYIANDLKAAVRHAKKFAEHLAQDYNSCLLPDPKPPVVVLMSPGAASFDMFKNFSDRGDQFQMLVRRLS